MKNVASSLGPGLVAGAADDDPSGIGTYSQVGAQFGNQLLWTLLFSLPLMVAVQEISARIGRVTGRGIAGNLIAYPRWITYPIVFLLFAANTINIGADIAAMGAAAKLVFGGPILAYAVVFGVVSILLEIFVSYRRYSRWLKWLTLVLFSYVATAFAVKIPWASTLSATMIPHFSWSREMFTALIAVLGTTISPYLFFWQASLEVEELQRVKRDQPLRTQPKQARKQFRRIRVDTYVGMFFSALVAFFIMLTCAVTLHANGITQIETAAQAAEALRPVAGTFAFSLFALGIIGSGLLAVPVLAGSAAYAVGEMLDWRTGLHYEAWRARGFYAVIALATLLGLALDFTKLDPIKALYWTAVINGVVSVPVLFIMLNLARNASVMTRRFLIPGRLSMLGWLTCVVMLLATAGLVVSTVL